MSRSIYHRFLQKVSMGDCWEWKASKYPNGYGMFKANYGVTGAHRFSYEWHIGKIPEGMCVLHSCDNRACVNPGHLFIGTKKDNTHDMMRKGRFRYKKPKVMRGMESPSAKISDLSVQRIRLVGRVISQRELGKIFGVGQQQISRILKNERWQHVGVRNALL